MYELVVLRHDVVCGTCRDLLVAVYLVPKTRVIAGIMPLVPWENEMGALEPDTFLAQLVGHSLRDPLRPDDEIDGISGATLTVKALLSEIRGLSRWLAGRPE